MTILLAICTISDLEKYNTLNFNSEDYENVHTPSLPYKPPKSMK